MTSKNNPLWFGEPKNDRPTDYPELEKETHGSGIYHHICPKCNSEFMGYKSRCFCLDCNRAHNKSP